MTTLFARPCKIVAFIIPLLVVLALACNGQAVAALFATPTYTPTATYTSSPTPTNTPTPTPTNTPTHTPTPTFTPTPTPSLDDVTLHLDDLPKGFGEVSKEEQERLGLSAETLSARFNEGLTEAEVYGFDLFIRSDPQSSTVEFIACFALYPLTPFEQASFDLAFEDPLALADSFATGMAAVGGVAQEAGILEGADGLGDNSVGVTILTQSDTGPGLRINLVLVRRGSLMPFVMHMFNNNGTPVADAIALAEILDERATAVLLTLP